MPPLSGLEQEDPAVVEPRELGVEPGLAEQFAAERFPVEPEAGLVDIQLPDAVLRFGVEPLEAEFRDLRAPLVAQAVGEEHGAPAVFGDVHQSVASALVVGRSEAVEVSVHHQVAVLLVVGDGLACEVLLLVGHLLGLELHAEETEPFIAATLNRKGWLAVTAEKRNYKGCVSVYDTELDSVVFSFDSSRRFVIDAYVLDDGEHVAAVTLGQENSVFVSNVVLYDLTGSAPKAETEVKDGVAVVPVADYDVSDGLVAAIGQQGDAIVTVSDTGLTFADEKGEVAATYGYQGGYLREYDLAGDDFTVLLLSRYQTGSVGRLVTVGADGAELGSLDVNQEVLAVSACGRYLAVLYLDSLVVYNRETQTRTAYSMRELRADMTLVTMGWAVLAIFYYIFSLGYFAQTLGMWFYGLVLVKNDDEDDYEINYAMAARFFVAMIFLGWLTPATCLFTQMRGVHCLVTGCKVAGVGVGRRY